MIKLLDLKLEGSYSSPLLNTQHSFRAAHWGFSSRIIELFQSENLTLCPALSGIFIKPPSQVGSILLIAFLLPKISQILYNI